VIDDEESIRYAVDAGLEFLGDYDVHFARDGKTGIEDKAFLPTLSCRLSAG
jgi:CheY-like chemotaxis protein